MYTSFYKLHQKPFALHPDPQFLWLSENHQEALTTLRQGILENTGFLLLTGESGTGKTVIVNELIRTLADNTVCAMIADHSQGRLEFYNTIANAFQFDKQFSSKVQFLIQFSHFLHHADDAGKKVILVVDDCHKLSQDMLEELQLFSNIEKADAKLINIFFVGQPGFNEILVQPKNRAIRQRLTRKAELVPLRESETMEYIRHRLWVAGAQTEIFTLEALTLIHQFSRGIPRKINILCDNVLNVGAAQGVARIDEKIIEMCVVRLDRPGLSGDRHNGDSDHDEDAVNGAEELAVPPIGATRPPVFGYNLEREQRRGWWAFGFLALLLAMTAGFLWVKFRQPKLPEVISSPAVELAAKSTENNAPVTALPVASIQPLDLSAKRETAAELQAAIRGQADDTATKATEAKAAAAAVGHDRVVAIGDENQLETATVPASRLELEPAAMVAGGEESGAAVSTTSSAGAQAPGPTAAEKMSKQAVPDGFSATTDGVRQSPEETGAAEKAVPVAVLPPPAAALQQAGPLLPPFEPRTVVLPLRANSIELTNEAERLFDDFVKRLREYPKATLMVRGYVSAQSNSPENIKLSAERARGVYDLLVKSGVDAERVELKGMGNQDPIAANDTAAGRQKNRRVEIQVVDDGIAH